MKEPTQEELNESSWDGLNTDKALEFINTCAQNLGLKKATTMTFLAKEAC